MYFTDVPVCRSSDPEFIGVSIGESVNVICEVDGNPDNLQYSWSFRNSSSYEETLITIDQPNNILIYTPMSEHDFGSLLCTATNNLGSQRLPCVYTLILAGNLLNISVTIRCYLLMDLYFDKENRIDKISKILILKL